MPKHIVRLMLVLAAFFVLAALAKKFFTADSFYEYGHYRGASVPEIAAQEPVFQTSSYCKDCHEERHSQWSASNHKSVTCEVCHGAAKGHPESGKLPIPKDSVKLCALCHEEMPARPRTQPQVDIATHPGGQQCVVCHNPHSPKIATAKVKLTGDAAAGKRRAADCAGCHGDQGISPNDTWPNLAGQNAAYLVRIMTAYKSGDQHDVVMTPIAQPLTAADIQNLAAYYAGLSCTAPPNPAGAGDIAAGKALAANCKACHGETGAGANPAWPRFDGQKAGYLVNVLKAFRAGLRKDPMMAGVSRGLSDADITNLAAYYAAQTCQTNAQGKKTP